VHHRDAVVLRYDRGERLERESRGRDDGVGNVRISQHLNDIAICTLGPSKVAVDAPFSVRVASVKALPEVQARAFKGVFREDDVDLEERFWRRAERRLERDERRQRELEPLRPGGVAEG